MNCEKNKKMSNIWRGVILEESLDNLSLLELARIKDSYKYQLEGEDRVMTFYNVEVDDSQKAGYVKKAARNIKDKFYTHLCKDGIITVIFRNKTFEFSKDHPLIESARKYGLSMGILPEQMCFERIIDNPFDE